jgi:NAD(P)H-dependent flavin oxidoreductase YrpB (nitropropane dioxygenase family)
MVLELKKAAESFSVAGLPVRVVAVSWARGGPASRLPAGQLAALYVAPGLEPEAAAIARETRARQVLTFTTVRPSVEAGLSVGLVNRGSRAGLVLNRVGVRAEGADLDSALLAIAEVVEGTGGPRP